MDHKKTIFVHLISTIGRTQNANLLVKWKKLCSKMDFVKNFQLLSQGGYLPLSYPNEENLKWSLRYDLQQVDKPIYITVYLNTILESKDILNKDLPIKLKIQWILLLRIR
ncbi:unnamed protein product [Paramecium sonneborni]|uniref:Uncharacterized protein n=1 Tax=Paramecium sonneborni TaxID=65129 RepID=A0A8S1RBU6_9CILI|nr:unnamed protein product [Paramecium sonneborni]